MMPGRASPKSTSAWWKGLALVFVVCCLVIDFFPRHSPPDFRYTGSDPAYEVWNLGWPFAFAIYDQRNGLHLGPFFHVVVAFQVLVLVMSWLCIIAITRPRNQPAMSPH